MLIADSRQVKTRMHDESGILYQICSSLCISRSLEPRVSIFLFKITDIRCGLHPQFFVADGKEISDSKCTYGGRHTAQEQRHSLLTPSPYAFNP